MRSARSSAARGGYGSRLLEELDREGLVERTTRGGVSRVSWRDLLQRRAVSYGVFTTNRIQRFVCPNGPAYALEVAGASPVRGSGMALTGSFAPSPTAAVAPPGLPILYAETQPSVLIATA